jgi:hypothetical protein
MITTHPRLNRTHHDHHPQGGGDPGWCVHIRHDAGERVTVFVRCGPHSLTRTAPWHRVPAMAGELSRTLHRDAERMRNKRPRVSEQLSRIAMNVEGLVEKCMDCNKVIAVCREV